MRQLLKRVRWIGVSLLMLLISLAAQGQEFAVGAVTYAPRGGNEVAVKQILVSSASSRDTMVIDIPSTVENGGTKYSVTAVGTGEGCGSVLAFGTTAGETTISVPSTVCDVYAGTFGSTNQLSAYVTVEFKPNTNIKSWPVGMFKDANLRGLVLPEGVWTDIPKDFARNAQFKRVVLPSNCRSIGEYAFAHDDKKGAYIIDEFKMNYGLQTIGAYAFLNNNPQTQYVSNHSKTYRLLQIPSSVTTIGESSFEGMGYISRLVIPGSIREIPKRAFAEWDGADDLTICEGVQTIGNEAFWGIGSSHWTPYGTLYTGVGTFCVPSTVTSIGWNFIAKFDGLSAIELHNPTVPDGRSSESIMEDDRMKDITLWVPKSGYERFLDAHVWRNFKVRALKSSYGGASFYVKQNIKEGGTVSGEGYYDYGQRVTLQATPAEGYVFKGWLRGDLVISTEARYEFYASAEGGTHIMGVFEPKGGNQSTRPDALYKRVDFQLDSRSYLPEFGELTLFRGLERDPDWKIDIKADEYDDIWDTYFGEVRVEYIHAHPDKYPNEIYDNVAVTYNGVDERFEGFTRLYYNATPQFMLQTERDAQGNLVPSYTMRAYIPIINTKTSVRDTICYTADVFMPEVAAPDLGQGLSWGLEVRSLKNVPNEPKNKKDKTDRKNTIMRAPYVTDNFYDIRTAVAGLDRVNGFDVELTVTRTKDGTTTEVESKKRHYGPGELKTDDKIFDDESRDDYNNYLALDANSRYVVSAQRVTGDVDSDYDYTFNLRARNYNADGTPGNWVQDSYGKPSRTVDVSELSAWVTDDKVDISQNDVTKIDNEAAVQRFISTYYDQNLPYYFFPHNGTKNNVSIVVNKYPKSWGDCRLLMDATSDAVSDKTELYSKIECKKKYTVTFPTDGGTHSCYLEWPDIGLVRTVTFTDYTPQNYNRYRFNVKLYGGGISNVKDLYMVYETEDGDITGKLIKEDQWKKLSMITFFEDRKIKRVISLADSVALGTPHVVMIPGKLDDVKQLKSMNYKLNSELESMENNISLYAVTNVRFKLIDASTGKQIRKNLSIDGDPSSYTVCADGTLDKSYRRTTSYADDRGQYATIINADGYIPLFLRGGIEFAGNKIYADGYVGYVDSLGVAGITLPMRKRVYDGRPFDVMNVYYRTPGRDAIKPSYQDYAELPWVSSQYSGPSETIAFEGGFQPVRKKADGYQQTEIPTLAVTVAFYDTTLVVNYRPLSGVLSSMKLRAKNSGRKLTTVPGQRPWMICLNSSFKDIECIGDLSSTYPEILGGELRYSKRKITHDPDYKCYYVTYTFTPKNTLVGPEDEDEIYVSLGGYEIKLGTFKNLTENAMYLADEAATEAPMGEERIGTTAQEESLDKFDDAFRNFSLDLPENNEEAGIADFDIELPTQGVLLPFNVGVQKINNDYIIRGVVSYNFLPGGPMMDLMDKTDQLADIDKVFYDVQRAVTKDKTEYAREDRALGSSTAFVGVRGWLEGRFTPNSHGYYVPQAAGMGIKTETSAFLNSGINSPFFRAGVTLGGELSTYVALDAAIDTTGIGWAVNKDAKFLSDVVTHSTVAMNTSLYVGAGLDLYIARAICGVKGSLEASYDAEVRYRPYLQGARKKYDSMTTKPEIGVPDCYTYAGSKMHVGGSVKAYAEAKFLWWKWRKEATLASFDKTWYLPDDYTNPLWKADEGKQGVRKMLRSSVYRPLQLSAAPEHSNIVLRDIDTYAEPRYLFGGTDMAYYKINSANMGDAHINFRGGATFNGGKGEPIVSADVSSTQSSGIIAYEVSTAAADQVNDEDEAPKHMTIKASVNNGAGWTAPTMLTDAHPANYTPRTAIDAQGRAAVVWKGGEFVASEWGSEVPGNVNGSLYLKRFDGQTWGSAVPLMTTGASSTVTDYSLAMLGGKPYMLAAIGKETRDGDPTFSLSALAYNADGDPMLIANDGIKASCPQLVNFNDKLYGAAIISEGTNEYGETEGTTKADVHLYKVATDGMLEDLGSLGLENRNIADFRLVTSAKAMALVWRESTPILNEKTNEYDFTPSVYGALLRSSTDDKGNTAYFLSCPQLIAKADNGLDISYYDAYLPDESSMTGAVTLYDSETGGANVVESTNYFDNDYTIRHAGIDTKVEQGKDYGYYVVVFNEGKDVIDYVDMQLGDDDVKTMVPTLIYPGHDAVISDVALYTSALENGLVPKVTPHFNESMLKVRTYEQARAATAARRTQNRRRTGNRYKAAAVQPKIQLQVVDMNVRPLSTHLEGDDSYYVASSDTVINVPDGGKTEPGATVPEKYTTVLVNVLNDSPIRLKADYRTNISLYYDINGVKPYEYAHSVEIPASQFEADDNSTVARILVGKVPEDVLLYAVAVTVDGEGNVVKDQFMANNASPVRLLKNDLDVVPSGIDDVLVEKETKQDGPQTLDVTATDNGAVVKGLVAGQTLRVYDTMGRLLHLYRAASSGSEHFIRLAKHGVYLFSTGEQSLKLTF